jgi:hypothetical protein
MVMDSHRVLHFILAPSNKRKRDHSCRGELTRVPRKS